MTDTESKIARHIHNLLEERGLCLDEPLERGTVLLSTGLDSLAFAVLVVRLEEDLGYDPFLLMEEAVYPRTFGEFVRVYEQYQGTQQ